ncbi:hypothetical protein BH23PLA1_BH23PLA1_10770 [soil metagenome]
MRLRYRFETPTRCRQRGCLTRKTAGKVLALPAFLAAALLLLSSQVSEAQEVPSPAPLPSPADQPEYWAALKLGHDQPALPVGFRDLWENPEAFQGRWVRVEGKVERRFRQGSTDLQPALTETWIFSPAMDPICLVFPESEGDSPPPGARVRFEGTFLGHVRYSGEDVPRLAPLIVGPGAPELLSGPPTGATAMPIEDPFTPLGWVVGGIAAGMVVMLLLRQAMSRPSSRRAENGPAPRFVDHSHMDDSSTIMDGDGPRLEPPTDPTQ